jgi:peptide/nickel transport system ATP-binding protein
MRRPAAGPSKAAHLTDGFSTRQEDPPRLGRRRDAPLLEVNGLKRNFETPARLFERLDRRTPRAVVKAVDGVSFTIRRGETFALVGESGCGKSTVARCIVGLQRPSTGSIAFDGTLITGRRDAIAPLRRRIQMIFQDPYASLDPRWRVRRIVAEPLVTHRLVADKADLDARVAELLTQVRLSPADADRYPHEFSGGQRQRISIARALAARPDFIVCDEPTSALDVSVQAQILNLMRDLQAEFGLTYLFISHNLAVIDQFADRVGVMYLGRLVEIGDTQTLFAAPRHPYTRLLLDAVPRLDRASDDAGTAEAAAGDVPDSLQAPPGCAFHPRCPFADDRCRSERPELNEIAGSSVACHAVREGRLPETPRAG